MWKGVPAGIAATMVLATTAMAQQAAPSTDGARSDRSERAARMTAEDRSALVDARIASLRAGLKLNAEQEKNWPAVEAAIRDLAKERAQRAAQRSENRQSRERDPIERMRASADAMSQRAAALKKLADASEPLYRSLDDGQKRRMRVLTRRALQPHHGLRRW